MPRKIRRFLPVVAAAALATSGFAYMASNTVDASNAGQGSADISGYTVTGIHYVSDSTHKSLNEVDFTLTADAPTANGGTTAYKKPTEVFAEVHSGSPGTTYQYTCHNTGTAWASDTGGYSCLFSSNTSGATLPIKDVTKLRVIAHQ